MSITDPPPPSPGSDPRFIRTPTLHMADGASLPTASIVRLSLGTLNNVNATYWKFRAGNFATYLRNSRRLYYPDGSFCDYEAGNIERRRILECRNALGHLEVSFDWQPTSLRVK